MQKTEDGPPREYSVMKLETGVRAAFVRVQPELDGRSGGWAIERTREKIEIGEGWH